MKSKSLQYLVKEVSKQNEEAFNELYRRYYKLVYYIALQLTKSSADAEDVLQETFVQMQHSIDTLRDPKQFKAWIARIAYTKTMKSFQMQRDTGLSDLQLELMSKKLEKRSDFLPERTMRNNSEKEALDNCIGNLRVTYREVLVLYYFGQLNIREIAETMKIPEGTVKSRLLYGKKYLREELEKYEKRTGEKISFEASSLEAMLTVAGASMATTSTSMLSSLIPIKHVSIPPTTVAILSKIAIVSTIACGTAFGGYQMYEKYAEMKDRQPLVAKVMDVQEHFPVVYFQKQEITTAREAYEILQKKAHCDVELKTITKEEQTELYLIYQTLEQFGGTYQQLMHRDAWGEQFLKYSEM